MNKSSMLYWYPKVRNLPIPQPRTEFFLLPEDFFRMIDDRNPGEFIRPWAEKMLPVAEQVGFPLFLRTDLASGKFDWSESCYVETPERLARCLWGVIEFNLCADVLGLDFEAVIFREYVPMDERFRAFRGMPINPERRYFVRDGKVVCHHAYWIEDAIRNPDAEDWRDRLVEANRQMPDEIFILRDYAMMVSQAIRGFWSVDFCRAKDGRWYLIDMALGDDSWHPECPKSGESDVHDLEV